MHGVIFMQLKDFVVSKHGLPAWDKMLQMAKLPEMAVFMPTQAYPDEEATALFQAASELTGQQPDALLESFGIYIAPALLQMYRGLIDPSWKALDLFMNVEETIHKVVRVRNKGALPPELFFTRIDDSTLQLHYESKRKLAAVAIGIMKGVARHYGEIIDVTVIKATPDFTDIRIRRVD